MVNSRQPMAVAGYPESELVRNRASLLLHGGGDSDRRAWAEEAATNFAGEGLTVVDAPARLSEALARTSGVVFVPDTAALGTEAQAKILHVLLEKEEKAKWVLGLNGSPADVVAKGLLHDAI